ncbi:hypothetical protein RND71_026556 [Anisodus tanguticus]|uniref:Uncharacterized protein n=1 Tax=Anisodus tanguticus TaxID=243964 RepID=A0AAE1RP42_9SOLA|nr:hypothetical protein RND71_026556 [Anisodus tanguticus]
MAATSNFSSSISSQLTSSQPSAIPSQCSRTTYASRPEPWRIYVIFTNSKRRVDPIGS